MTNSKKLPQAIRLALLASSALVAGNAFAQDNTSTDTTDTKDTKTLDRIEVTGSRIKRAEVEGALPVTVISRKDIEVSGKTSVADLLQNSTFNSFGSARPASGSSMQSFSELNLRGLSGGRSLLLIDGHRAPASPMGPDGGNDLSMVPLAAVERIEILSDGASAIYGADAIGGVVNIITRKDFNGVEASLGQGYSQRGGDTEEGSIILGASNDRGRLLGGVSYANRGITFVRDLEWMGKAGSSFANNYYHVAIDPNTGTRLPGAGLSTGETGGLGRQVPGGCTNPGFYLGDPVDGRRSTQCYYDYNLVAGDTASIKQKSLFVKGDYQINDDWSVYLNAAYTAVDSFGRFAPSLADRGIFIPANTPNNPYDFDVMLKHRFAAVGPRDNQNANSVTDFNVGFNWQASDRISVDFGLRRSDSRFVETGFNYINVPIATQLIQDGTYNIYDPLSNDPAVLAQIRATVGRDSHYTNNELYALANFDLFDLAGGTSGLAVGLEHVDSDYADLYDAQSAAGNIGGSSGNSSFGTRKQDSIYAEWLLPFTSWFETDLAVRHDRYDDFGSSTNPKVSVRFHPLDSLTLRASYGTGFRAPPLNILTQQPAFSADAVVDPDTALAFGLPPGSAIQIDGVRVATADLQPEKSKQWSAGVVWDPLDWLSLKLDYYNIKIDNQIKFYSAGTVVARQRSGLPLPPNLYAVRDPATNALLRVYAGYGNEGQIHTDGFDFNAITKFDLGNWGRLTNDLSVSYVRKYDITGLACADPNAATCVPVNSTEDAAGTVGAPRWRANLVNQWEKGDFSLAWTIHAVADTPNYTADYIAAVHDYVNTNYGTDYPTSCHDIAADEAGLAAAWSAGGTGPFPTGWGHFQLNCDTKPYITHDISASYKTPWNGKVTIGAINVTGRKPRLDSFNGAAGTGNYDNSQYDAYGRQVYFRYTQTF